MIFLAHGASFMSKCEGGGGGLHIRSLETTQGPVVLVGWMAYLNQVLKMNVHIFSKISHVQKNFASYFFLIILGKNDLQTDSLQKWPKRCAMVGVSLVKDMQTRPP